MPKEAIKFRQNHRPCCWFVTLVFPSLHVSFALCKQTTGRMIFLLFCLCTHGKTSVMKIASWCLPFTQQVIWLVNTHSILIHGISRFLYGCSGMVQQLGFVKSKIRSVCECGVCVSLCVHACVRACNSRVCVCLSRKINLPESWRRRSILRCLECHCVLE